MDSIIQTLMVILYVLLDVKSLKTCLEVLPEYNIAVQNSGYAFYRSRAGDCQGKNLGVVRDKIDKYDSPPTFSILYGNRGKWHPKVKIISHKIDRRHWT